jgi:hypothetical protein
MVRNECLRFGGHVGIHVRYKILQLEVLKDSPFLVTSPCFQYLGVDLRQVWPKTPLGL